LGAAHFIDSTKKDFAKEHSMAFDLIISTTDAGKKDFPMDDYLSYATFRAPADDRMLNVNGTFNQCGLPNESLPEISPFTFVSVSAEMLALLIVEWWTFIGISYRE
jgi:alcohol dehydrogenase (NADP+)